MHSFYEDRKKTDTVTIVILNDGETYTSIRGCSICVISADEADKLDAGEITCGDLNPIAEIGLDSLAN
jgi:hypothetical protein